MAEFSYSSDISPLKGEYFSGSSLSDREQSMLTSKFRAVRDPAIETQIKLQNEMIKLQSQDLQFRTQQFQLERAKEEAKLERESLAAIPEATKALTSIMDNPELDDYQKMAGIAEVRFKLPQLATTEKGKALFAGAEDRLMIRKAEEDRTNALAYSLAQAGEPEAVAKIMEGKNNPMAEEYIIGATASRAAKEEEKRILKESGLAKAAAEREAATLTAQTTLMKDYMSTLRKLSPPKEDETGMQIGTLSGDKTKQSTIPQAKPFKFAEEDKSELQIMATTFGVPLEEISKLSDIDLYRLNLRATTSALRNLSGFGSGGDTKSGFGFPANKFLPKPPQ